MKRFTIFSLAVLLALGAWTETRAQDEPEPADVEENGAVVDHDEDGIDDNKARRHRGSGRRGGRGMGKFKADLTAEQQAALKETVEGLRQSGASREEVHAAVGAQLQSYGVELPENWEDRPTKGQRGGRGLGKLGADLTAEQQAALKETVQGLRQSGASREEVHTAVGAQLQSYGVELPENWEDGPAKGQRRGHRFGKRGRRGAAPPPAETAPAPEAGF